MARSGGTLISKCLGSMGSVALLSEIHPMGAQQFNPLQQAVVWHNLISKGEAKSWTRSRRPMSFADVMGEINKRARERGAALVVREWSHLDVIGHPFVQPSMRPVMIEELAGRFEIAQAITVRHPVDQYLSLVRLDVVKGMTVEGYLRGCRVFAEWAQAEGFVRYEDFTADPDASLRALCERLRVEFDPSYAQRWAAYDKVTGDTAKANTGRGAAEARIRSLPRRETPDGLLDAFRASADYARTLELLGYEDA